MSGVICTFWKSGLSLLVNVSRNTLVLEVWIVAFCEGLVEFARFGSLGCRFLRMSRVICSFRKPGLSLFANVSWNLLVLEVWIVAFCEWLVKFARFGRLDFGECLV